MYRQVPNLITLARLALTVVFFVMLHVHVPAHFVATMWWGFGVFVVAGLTDILDGYLARAWKVESAFGRIVDPFVDKIMVCGAFVIFAAPDLFYGHVPGAGRSVTGVAPWMAVVLIGREFLITGIRGLAEAKGIDFRADWAGKVKMFVQSFAIGAILVDLAVAFVALPDGGVRFEPVGWVRMVRDVCIWTTVVVTVASATTYIIRARKLM